MDELKPGQFQATEPGAPGAAGGGCLKWVGIGCAIPVVLILIAILIGALSPKAAEKPYDPNWSGEAIAQCEDLVKDNLKAPSTAEFDTSATGSGTWTVRGTVDSENSFGATLRAEFQCTVVIDGQSISRRLDFLN